MIYSISSDISQEEFQKLVPKFLKFLNSYGYNKAVIRSSLNFKKGSSITTSSNMSIDDVLKKLSKSKFHSGKIKIFHKGKLISLSRSPYTHDLSLEMNFQPDPKFKTELENLFITKKR